MGGAATTAPPITDFMKTLFVLVAMPLAAHDLWIEPTTFFPTVGQVVGAKLRVGQDLLGDPVPRSSALINELIAVDGTSRRALIGREGADPAGLANGTHTGQLTIGASTTVNVSFTVQSPQTPTTPTEPPQAASVSVSADLIQLNFTQGIAPAPTGLQLDGTPGLPFRITSSANWLTTTPSSGTLPATVRVSPNPGAVPPGEYEVLLTVTAPGASSQIVRVRVSITETPQFIAIPTGLALTHTIGETPPPVNLYLTSKGRHGRIQVLASSDRNWLAVTPEIGNTPINLRVTFNPTNLTPGQYTGSIRIESLDNISAPITIPVTLEVR